MSERCGRSDNRTWILVRTLFFILHIRTARRTSIFYHRAGVCCEQKVTGGCATRCLPTCPDCIAEFFFGRRTSTIHNNCRRRAAYHTTRAESPRRIGIGRPLFLKHCRSKVTVLFGFYLRHWSFSFLDPPWKIISISANHISFHLCKAFLRIKVTCSILFLYRGGCYTSFSALPCFSCYVRIYGLSFLYLY